MTHAGQCVCWGWGSTPLSKREDTTKIVEGYMGPRVIKALNTLPTAGGVCSCRKSERVGKGETIRHPMHRSEGGTFKNWINFGSCLTTSYNSHVHLPMPNSNSSQASYIINFSYFCYSTYELYLFITRKINNVGCLCNS